MKLALSLLFILALGACGGNGCGCTAQPLPGGALPADQTVEGGGQLRVSPAGMAKVNQLITATVQDAIRGGVCVSPMSVIGFTVCGNDNTQPPTGACGQRNGCEVAMNLDDIQVAVRDADTMNVRVQLDARATSNNLLFGCDINVSAQDLVVDADIDIGIDPADGELTLRLGRVNNTNFSGTSFDGCSIISDIANIVVAILDSFIGDFIIDLFTPTLNNLIQGFLPDPLGIAGLIDMGGMLESISPGTEALLEGRIVPGGYASLNGGGMTIGLITGFNADEDITTRSAALDSEPSLCVPPIPSPDFAAAPHSLPRSARSTFTLPPAGAFSGSPEPNGDLAIGLSETTLDLLGHHVVTSGSLCLGVGTALVSQLNLSTLGLLVPSATELGSDRGNDPVLLLLRPQRAVDFQIGDGTPESPTLNVGINNLEIDFYAFLYERYTRLFTLSVTVNVGVNLMIDNAASPPTVTPILTGLSADQVQVKVLNSEFLRETPADLEAILPTVFDLALPLIAGGLGPIDLPNVGGFALRNLAISKVSTSQDDFLSIVGTLVPGAALRALAVDRPALTQAIASMTPAQTARTGGRAKGNARLLSVRTPSPEDVQAALHGTGGDMPTVTVDVDRFDAAGRPLEWSYRLDGGMWRKFSTQAPLVIRDPAFAWQGAYKLELTSRVVGDDLSLSDSIVELPLIIDSVAPVVHEDTVTWEGDELVVTAFDIVSAEESLRFAFARPDTDEPMTAWQRNGRLPRSEAERLMVDGALHVFVRDEMGNLQMARVNGFHGQPGEGGCNCEASSPSGGGIALALVTLGFLFLRRRNLGRWAKTNARYASHSIVWLALPVLASMQACDCNNDPGARACEMVSDCQGFCENGEIPFCIDNSCVCSDDIPAGRVGPYSDVAVSASGTDTWVSAYAQSHGDLTVARAPAGRIEDTAWEWVDGVPDVAPKIKNAMIRRGIEEPGEDVGMYTSIAVASDGQPRVSYFDRDGGSLKFALRAGDGSWQKHVVDAGTGSLEPTGTITGMYTSLSLRADGRPAIAYMAHVADASGLRAEVRYAFASSAAPATAADWTVLTVDGVGLPATSEGDIFPLPRGLGLFVDMARDPAEVPVVVYYDRQNGNLKMSRFDTVNGIFAPPTIVSGSSNAHDSGWSPSVAVSSDGTVHVAFVSATFDDLLYRNVTANVAESIDNGYRIVGQNEDGLPKPEFHFVGDDVTLLATPSGPVAVYQDATTHELLMAERTGDNTWIRTAIAGDTADFAGAYGFFASAAVGPTNLVMTSWVIDQPNDDQWVEVFQRERGTD